MTQKKDAHTTEVKVKKQRNSGADLIKQNIDRDPVKLPADFRDILISEIKVLRVPLATPKYPFKPQHLLAEESECVQTGFGSYLFTDVDYAIIRFLWGTNDLSKVEKSKLKDFLVNKCNVSYSGLEKISWPEIREFSFSGIETGYADQRSRTNDNVEGNDIKLPPSIEKAYQSYHYAISQNLQLADSKDRDVYDWLKENGVNEYNLPVFETWQRYLRSGRKYYGTSKNTPRTGRILKSSVSSTDPAVHQITNKLNKAD